MIGPLFLLDGVLSSLTAVALVALRHPLVAALGVVIELGAIGGLALATTTGLFGFRQLGIGVGGDILAAFVTEGFAAATLATAVVLDWRRAIGAAGRAPLLRVLTGPGRRR